MLIKNPEKNMELSRRRFLALTGGIAAAAALLPRGAFAAVAPHSFKHGDFEVTVISDGQLQLPSTLLGVDAPAEERAALFKEVGIGESVTPAVNLTLVKAGNDLILFDTGAGGNMAPTAGKMLEALAAAGIDPAAITKVVYSHGHPDHVWGTLNPDGSLRFPKATYVVAADEWDFWMDADILKKLPEGMHQMATETQRQLGAVKDVVTRVKPGEEIVSGIGVLDTRGHTPGHVSFELAGGDGLIIVADVIPNPLVYFPNPHWKFGFDANHDNAIAARKMLLDKAAGGKATMLGYHWAYPGLGHAEKKGTGYTFVPAT